MCGWFTLFKKKSSNFNSKPESGANVHTDTNTNSKETREDKRGRGIRIRVIQPFSTRVNFKVGEVFTLPPTLARRLVEKGYVVYLKDTKTETKGREKF
jgi:hypothetical protein